MREFRPICRNEDVFVHLTSLRNFDTVLALANLPLANVTVPALTVDLLIRIDIMPPMIMTCSHGSRMSSEL